MDDGHWGAERMAKAEFGSWENVNLEPVNNHCGWSVDSQDTGPGPAVCEEEEKSGVPKSGVGGFLSLFPGENGAKVTSQL